MLILRVLMVAVVGRAGKGRRVRGRVCKKKCAGFKDLTIWVCGARVPSVVFGQVGG